MSETPMDDTFYVAPEEPPASRRPPATSVGILGWLRENLFGSLADTISTVITVGLILFFISGFLGWALFEAQWEIAFLNLVILPQALRLIIPPLGNQYVNLGKNSSLAIAVTYFDTYRIAQLANNESGQAVPFFIGLMAIYLALSLTLSVLTNLVNRATQVKTR